jgi:hypothetical protein
VFVAGMISTNKTVMITANIFANKNLFFPLMLFIYFKGLYTKKYQKYYSTGTNTGSAGKPLLCMFSALTTLLEQGRKKVHSERTRQ